MGGDRGAGGGGRHERIALACALGEDGPPDGQEELLRKVELFDRFADALLVRLPGTEMSMLGALAFLVRERGG